MKRIVLLFICLAVIGHVQAAMMYRWVDSSGVVHYSDVPSVDAEKINSMKFSDGVTQSENLPYETRRAQQNFPVTLYVGTGCGETCDQARSLLNKRGVPFSEKLLQTKQDVEVFKQLSGFDGVPALAVGKSFLKGFSESQWNSELDVAGYPKTASYRQRIAPPVPPVIPPAAEEGQKASPEPAAQ
jgi:hypothetical protein